MTSVAVKPDTAKASAFPPSSMEGASLELSDSVSPVQRHMMIAEAAFFIAQSRGFAASEELSDWLIAEREIDERLSSANR